MKIPNVAPNAIITNTKEMKLSPAQLMEGMISNSGKERKNGK